MKTVTCKEMGGTCDMEFTGETMEEVAGMGGKHLMNTSDEAHKPMREMMANSKKEDQAKWFSDFKANVWDKK